MCRSQASLRCPCGTLLWVLQIIAGAVVGSVRCARTALDIIFCVAFVIILQSAVVGVENVLGIPATKT